MMNARKSRINIAAGLWIGALILNFSLLVGLQRRLLLEEEEPTAKALLLKGDLVEHGVANGQDLTLKNPQSLPMTGRVLGHIESEESFRQRQSSLYAFHDRMHPRQHPEPTNHQYQQNSLSIPSQEEPSRWMHPNRGGHPSLALQHPLSIVAQNNTVFPAPIKLPFPVFVASLYKSGTTTAHSFFECGGQRSVHWRAADGSRTGKCLRENILAGRKPFDGCGDYDIWTDNSFLRPPRVCWDPSVSNLEEIYQAYPNATILLTVRDSRKWIESVVHWGRLLRRLSECRNLWPDHPKNRKLSVEDIRQFYLWQIQHVRDFALAHPSMTFLEVSLESEETASILEERIGIPATCWGHHNKNKKKDRSGINKIKDCRQQGLDPKACAESSDGRNQEIASE